LEGFGDVLRNGNTNIFGACSVTRPAFSRFFSHSIRFLIYEFSRRF